MIKFFRKIRYDLMEKNKTGKYLKYAIGEIILVVIGILIALSINNWNEQNKNTELELTYYSRILDDFNLDKKLIEELVEKANKRIIVSKEILLELDSGKKDKNFLLNKFLVALRSDAYVPRNVTFKDLISSGNLKLLNDVTIKNSLIQYYSELENKQSQLKHSRDEKTKESYELVNSSTEFGLIEFDYVNKLLGAEIVGILPKVDWTKDKNSQDYKNFQMMLLFNIAMADREKQHLSAINNLMESPYQLLLEKNGKKIE
jgi:Family of unknown function (DUF6090)